MKQITTFLLLSVLTLLAACKKEEHKMIDGGHAFYFYPRECRAIITMPLKKRAPAYKSDWQDQVDSTGVTAKLFLLGLQTGTEELPILRKERPTRSLEHYEWFSQSNEQRFPLAPSIIRTEKQIIKDLYDYYGKPDLSTPGVDAMQLDPWEYRVTGVTNFQISATTTLFNLPAGSSLNAFFSIFEFKPRQVISYHTKALMWGYMSKQKLEDIAQWLYLKPMAPPIATFQLRETPPEVPTKVQFVTTLTTTDGLALRDTTAVLLK